MKPKSEIPDEVSSPQLRTAGAKLEAAESSSLARQVVQKRLLFFSFCYAVMAATAIAADRHLYVDGSAYLLYDILLGGHFPFPQRSFSYIYYQGPTLLAIAAGVHSIPALSCLYGVVLFSPPIIGAWLSWSVCRRRDIRLAFFPVFGCLSMLLSWMFYPVTEVHLTVSSFWPLFCFVLAWNPEQDLRWKEILVGGSLLLFFGLSHDSALFLGAVLALAALWRCRTIVRGRRAAIMTLGVAGAVITVAHTALNVSSMAVSGSNFFTGLLEFHLNKLLMLNIVALTCVSACFVPAIRSGWNTLLNAILLGVALYLVVAIVNESLELRPSTHQSTRAAAPLITMTMAAAVTILFRSRFWSVANWNQMWSLATIAFVCGVAWHTFATSQWIGYRRVFMNELTRGYGRIEFESTPLAREQFGQQALRAMTFLWELPHQSILWSQGEVTTIIYSKNVAPVPIVGQEGFPELAAFGRFVAPGIVP